MITDDKIMVTATQEAVDYIKKKNAKALTIMLTKSGGC